MKLYLEFPGDYPCPHDALTDLGDYLEALPGCPDYLKALDTPELIVRLLDEALLGGHYED